LCGEQSLSSFFCLVPIPRLQSVKLAITQTYKEGSKKAARSRVPIGAVVEHTAFIVAVMNATDIHGLHMTAVSRGVRHRPLSCFVLHIYTWSVGRASHFNL